MVARAIARPVFPPSSFTHIPRLPTIGNLGRLDTKLGILLVGPAGVGPPPSVLCVPAEPRYWSIPDRDIMGLFRGITGEKAVSCTF